MSVPRKANEIRLCFANLLMRCECWKCLNECTPFGNLIMGQELYQFLMSGLSNSGAKWKSGWGAFTFLHSIYFHQIPSLSCDCDFRLLMEGYHRQSNTILFTASKYNSYFTVLWSFLCITIHRTIFNLQHSFTQTIPLMKFMWLLCMCQFAETNQSLMQSVY